MTQPPTRYADIIGQDDSVARLSAFSEFYRKNRSTLQQSTLRSYRAKEISR